MRVNRMNILLPYKTRPDAPSAARDVLCARGDDCSLVRCSSAEKLRDACRSAAPDLILSSESDVLRRLDTNVPAAYLASDFCCPDKLTDCSCVAFLIPHPELSFDFINAGARDSTVLPCGVPLPDALRLKLPREKCLDALGIMHDTPTFLLLADGVHLNEIKSTVRATKTMFPDVQTLLLCSDSARRGQFMSAFASYERVYVLPQGENLPLALSAADVVFTAAFSVPVCGAARQGKIVILLRTPNPRARRNAQYLDSRGIAFRGKTAADNVSYSGRLLESVRLRKIMRDAQEKYILPDAEERLALFAEKIANTD